VPVTLNLFLALEFVFTLGIIILFRLLPAGVSASCGTLVEPYGN